MSDRRPCGSNPETRGTAPVVFFEADGVPPPTGTKASPRPVGRPRELPPDGPSPTTFQLFESEESSGAQGATGAARPSGQEKGGD
jgi:hypothetical protein